MRPATIFGVSLGACVLVVLIVANGGRSETTGDAYYESNTRPERIVSSVARWTTSWGRDDADDVRQSAASEPRAFRNTHAASEHVYLNDVLARMEAALVAEHVESILRYRAEILSWFELDPSRVRVLVALAGFGPIELQCEVARLVNMAAHLDETLVVDYIEAERLLMEARENVLPVSAPALQSIALDANVEMATRATALERLVKLHGDDPAIVDTLADLAETGDAMVRMASIALLTNVEHEARADLARRYIDDPDEQVRRAALRVAAYIDEDWAADALIAATREPLLALHGLAGLRNHPGRAAATEALVRVSRSGRLDLVPVAVRGLVHHARTSTAAQEELIRISRESSDAEVRAAALNGLRWSLDETASIETLRTVALEPGTAGRVAQDVLASI